MSLRNRSLPLFALLGLLATIALPASPATAAESPAPADFVGTWEGTLEVGKNRLRIVFHVHESQEGGLAATMDSPDQGASGIPIAAVTVDGDSIRLEVEAISADYVGRLAAEGGAIDGEWRQSGHVFPLAVARVELGAEGG